MAGPPIIHSGFSLWAGGFHSFTHYILLMLQFYNQYALLLQLKNQKQEKDSSCFLQGIQSTSQALCWPLTGVISFCPPMALSVELQVILYPR